MVDERTKRQIYTYWMNGVDDAEIRKTFGVSQEDLNDVVTELKRREDEGEQFAY